MNGMGVASEPSPDHNHRVKEMSHTALLPSQPVSEITFILEVSTDF